MIIKELGDEDSGASGGREIVSVKAKKVLVGAGARILFYPTLIYNVLRNKMQAEFRWWDQIDQFILLGAVPFPKDVPRLKQLGVRGVITLNEPYETLVPSDLYKVHGIDHLVIPTRDYLFAPSLVDICRAVDFIYRNASRGRTTYVHCKAGRGRSTTIVLCYLIEYKNMTPMAALDYVRSRRPRVLLAPSQWQAVQEYGRHKLEFPAIQNPKPTTSLTGDEVLITADDFEGYSVNGDSNQRISSCNAAKSRTIIMRHELTSPLGGDEVLITEADLEGYKTVLDACNEKCISSNQNNWTIIVRHAPRSSLGGDEVLITEADLEGYETFVDSDEKSIFSNQNNQASRPMMRKLSFLFTSLKFSTSPKPVAKLAPYNSCLIGCHTNSCLSFNVCEE